MMTWVLPPLMLLRLCPSRLPTASIDHSWQHEQKLSQSLGELDDPLSILFGRQWSILIRVALVVSVQAHLMSPFSHLVSDEMAGGCFLYPRI